MNDSKISVRYSKALFQLALDNNLLDEVNRDMLFISEICKAPEAKELIHNPVIAPSKKSAVFHTLLDGNVEKITLSLIDLAIKNGRESFIPSIARVFNTETLKHKGITEAFLTTAVPVDDAVKNAISEMVAKAFSTSIHFTQNIDSEIIGGFVLRVDDRYIDASVRNKLRRIKKELKS
jgi:F-type H+-transporting ATPase subunit delta